ncbi:MAG: post-PEP-CTERM-1 domain-containing protein [Pyrinomonadaceae bacterium]
MRSKQEGPSGKTRSIKATRTRVGVIVALVILCAAVAASIALPRSSSHASPKKYKATKETILDKATGTLRKPTPSEVDSMVDQISSLTKRPSDGPTTTFANGTTMMDLQGGFNGVMLGRATADGGTEMRCVFTLEEALDFLGLEEDQ